METKVNSRLLDIPEVRHEIEKHCWIESEKAGYDIGFDNAIEDWMDRYAEAWMNENEMGKSFVKTRDPDRPKKRSAKSYK